ncbi:MAG: DUF3015 family protein [Bdellovibrionales bacterium]|nr:DUF3015 family protein [Bdellovibrionales bacterium]
MKMIALLSIILFSFSAFAGDSGCGLGSVIISKNAKVQQLLSLTTNSYLFTQPLGITFGTSNCSASSIIKNDEEIKIYVKSNQKELLQEMAKGEGERLEALATLYGCTGEKVKMFSTSAQTNYAVIVTSQEVSSEELVTNIYKTIPHSTCVSTTETASL